MVKQTNKEKLSITLDLDVFEETAKRAEKEVRSISSMINKVLKDFYAMEKESK